jgi:hypothetical protein
MPLIVEDGLGLEDAESYISVADADAHHALYGNEDWLDFSEAEKEILLRRASRDLDILYGSRFDSTLLTTTQTLLWPRVTYKNAVGYAISGLPSQVKAATAELALLEGQGLSVLDTDETSNLKSISQSVDGVGSESKSFFYPGGAVWTKVSRVSQLLLPLLGIGPSSHYATVVRG